MFTFGIFTTNLPYIAMVAFYAYFLIFGVDKANDGKIKIVEKSQTVQIHISNSLEIVSADINCFYKAFDEIIETHIFEKTTVKRKWKHHGVAKFTSQDYPEYALFSRPPPTLA